jgi:hypothetical protein
MDKTLNLSKVGLTLQAVSLAEIELLNIADQFGTGYRSLNGGHVAHWRVDVALNNFPCYDEAVWIEILERTRRIRGELAKVDALLKKAQKTFPRNTQKEPQ